MTDPQDYKISESKETYPRIAKRKPPVRKSMLAKKLLIRGENAREFEDFRANLLEDLYPHTKIENFLAEKIIVSAWQLQRATTAEQNLLNQQNAIGDEERDGFDTFDALPRRRRIRNTKRIDLTREDARYLAELQIELQKIVNKTIERLRAEQRRNQQATPKK